MAGAVKRARTMPWASVVPRAGCSRPMSGGSSVKSIGAPATGRPAPSRTVATIAAVDGCAPLGGSRVVSASRSRPGAVAACCLYCAWTVTRQATASPTDSVAANSQLCEAGVVGSRMAGAVRSSAGNAASRLADGVPGRMRVSAPCLPDRSSYQHSPETSTAARSPAAGTVPWMAMSPATRPSTA